MPITFAGVAFGIVLYYATEAVLKWNIDRNDTPIPAACKRSYDEGGIDEENGMRGCNLYTDIFHFHFITVHTVSWILYITVSSSPN